jgi:DNA helicase-2/ATP-dependent DNA helicase PcrA
MTSVDVTGVNGVSSADGAAKGTFTPALRAALHGAEPTTEQWAAITGPLDRSHLIAGAGSGKTAVMAARIVWLVESVGVPPAAILGLTFTNKAAEELQERTRTALAASMRRDGDDVTVSTYHAFAADLVRSYGARVGVEPDASLLSVAQQYQLLLHLLEAERFEHLQIRSPGTVIQSVLGLAAACADHLVTPERMIEHARSIIARAEDGAEDVPRWIANEARERVELGRLVASYSAEKRRRGRLDFSDQITKAVELVESSEELAVRLRDRWQHLLLDEYQDTNVAQRRLLQRLAGDGSILAVGDARQAIYAFRGATMYNLLAFDRHFPSRAPAEGATGTPGSAPAGPQPAASEPAAAGVPLSLSVNFRSGRRILELANAIIEAVPAERRGGLALQPPSGMGAGEVRAALLSDQYAEAAFVADQIAAAYEDPNEQLEWRDIAVLVRNKRLVGPLREALEQRDVPVEVVGLSGLLETPEVVDVVSMLRVLDDPGANIGMARLLLGPKWRISPRHLYRLSRWCAKHNWALREDLPGEDPDPGDVAFALAEALDHLDEVEGLDDEARERLAAFREELRALRRHADGPLLGLVQTVLARTGVWAEIEASADRRAVSARRNLTAFLDRVATFAPVDGTPSLRAFLAYLDAVEEAAEEVEIAQPATADSVKLMTVHQAKGLEFPMVVIAGLAAGTGKDGSAVNGIFPSSRISNPLNARALPYELREDAAWLPRWTGSYKSFKAQLAERALEDERRLFYVAVTRAKRVLVLTAAWWYRGADVTPKGPSPFWREAVAQPSVQILVEEPRPETSPLADRLAQRRAWPPAARRADVTADPLFPEGYAAAVELARDDPAALIAQLDPSERAAYDRALALQQELIASVAPATEAPPSTPRALSVAQVLTYARCPRAFYWSVVRPLPSPPRPAARLGTLVHRILEQGTRRPDAPMPSSARPSGLTGKGASPMSPEAPNQSAAWRSATAQRAQEPHGTPRPAASGQAAEAAPGPTAARDASAGPARRDGGVAERIVIGPDELGEGTAVTARPGLVERATRNFRSTRFAALPLPQVEVEVTLRRGEWVIRGRIDAIYQGDDGVELVDWKTGADPLPSDGGPGSEAAAQRLDQLDQLGLYAVALRALGRLPGDRCRLTYCYLGADAPREHTIELGPAQLDQQQALLDQALAGIASGTWSGCGQGSCEACGRPRVAPLGPRIRPFEGATGPEVPRPEGHDWSPA